MLRELEGGVQNEREREGGREVYKDREVKRERGGLYKDTDRRGRLKAPPPH